MFFRSGIFSRFRNFFRSAGSFFSAPGAKFRIGAAAGAAVLGLAALFLAFSFAGSLFSLPFASGPGDFFVASYGLLAFIIPAYLFYAAFILADPAWRPGRIFVLSSLLFPFLTLAGGIAVIRNFENLSPKSPFLDFTGKPFFSFIIVFLVIAEILLIAAAREMLFPGKSRRVDLGRVRRRGRLQSFLLPAPLPVPNEVYAELAARTQGTDLNDKGLAGFVQENTDTAIDLAGPDMDGDFDDDDAVLCDDDPETDADFETGTDPEENCSTGMTADVERALWEAETAAALKTVNRRNGPETSDTRQTCSSGHVSRASYSVPVDILNQYPDGQYWIIDAATEDAAVTLKETLEEFRIQAEVTGIRKGPVITMFEILPAPGVKLSRIVNLQDNIALRLAASSVRIVAPIPGKHAVGIEVPNAKRNIVSFREIIEGELRGTRSEGKREGRRPEIPVVLGKDITGEAVTADLVQMPHLLIAGATGAGKSVCVNTMILSILYQRHPSECRLILIDPKIVELKLYNDIPHLLTSVITEPKRAFQALQYCIYEMERRYACLDSMGVRDIRSYNKRIREKGMAAEHMPYIVVVIDEFADLMATTGKELESTVARLAAMSRAVGIHLVLATQRPSIDVITGLIKANIPSRIAFMVASKMDSRIIIDMVGAEKLLGKGDMLYAGVVDPFPVRMQGAFVSEEEVEAVVEYVKTLGEPDYIDDEIFYDDEEDETTPSLFSEGGDPLYEKALEIVLQQGKASASYIQRRLKIGYNRSARLVEEMEHKGVVGPAQGSKPRELLRGA
ncbi:MAG: DNA translocase FtsK [Treponema sp.]|jgi:S-DNA-T family DNA segregation ATPase FtsK/SpoIIIE|nr:DNA translocase FtsK [Treponema sp.]